MARAIVTAALVALIKRRGYSNAAAAGSSGRLMESSSKSGSSSSAPAASSASTSWVPDPKTGYYRPSNKKGEIDAAEMRAQLLPHPKTQN